jgi:polar amino acid transport system substrate-binding protein
MTTTRQIFSKENRILKRLAIVSVLALTICLLCPFAMAQDRLSIVTPGIAPIAYEQDGKVTGIGTELVTEAFARLGQRVEITICPGARALKLLQQGEADALFALAKTPDRESFARFTSEPIIDQPISLFVRQDSTIVFDGDVKKLSPYSIGIIRGGRFSPEFETAIKNGLFPKLDQANEYRQNIIKLANQRIDILIGTRISVLFTAQKLGLQDAIKELHPPLTASSPAYLAFSKKSKAVELVAAFDSALKAMRLDGTYDRILEEYSR